MKSRTIRLKLALRRAFLLLTIVAFANLHISTAYAVSENQFKTENNILFYEPADNSSASCQSGSVASLVGSNNEEKAFRYLLAKGLSAQQAAGVVGNLIVESGVIPDNQQNGVTFPGGGWGIAQWTNSSGSAPGEGRRDKVVAAVKKAGLPYTNEATPADKLDPLLLLELNYMWDEATSRGDIALLKKETTVKGAAQSWLDNFEIAGVPATSERIEAGDKVLTKYGGVTPGDTTTTIGVTGGQGSCAAGVPSGNFVYYSQYDPAWANKPFGSSTIQPSGCGPSSMAMIVATLKDSSVTPDKMATWGSGYYIPGKGSDHDLFSAAAKHWGLKASGDISANEKSVKDALNAGGLVIGGGKGSAPFTSGGHVIVIRGIKSDGRYLVGNPLPLPGDQGKASADVAKNTAWLETGYTWAQLSANSSGMYAITK